MDKQRDLLIKIANELLLSTSLEEAVLNLSNEKLAVEIQKRFQKEIIKYYQGSGFREEAKTISSEEEILDCLANTTIGAKKGPTGYLPKLHRDNPSAEMECTLSSAFLKLAFEERGILNVRTCLLKGHQVTIKYLDDGSIQMYDSANTHTVGGARHGFSHLFTGNEVKNREDVQNRPDEKNAFTFEIQTTKTPQELKCEILDKDGEIYKKKFYAHDPQILISLSVILDNLNDAEVEKDTLFLKDLNYKVMEEKFNLLNKDKYLSFALLRF